MLGAGKPRKTFQAAHAAGELVYAVGDIHGRYDLLLELLGRIAADAASEPRERPPILVFLGDYVDRGPDSPRVIEALIGLKARNRFDLRLLKGNHEAALLAFLEEPDEARAWLSFGGDATLAAYGILPPAPDDDEVVLVAARDALLRFAPPSHLFFLKSLELTAQVGDYLFVHAGVRPGRSLAAQSEDDLLWIREPFLSYPGPFEKVVVHGHSWTDDEVRIVAHRIAVDTGAYATGVLSAVRIDDAGVGLISTRGSVPVVAASHLDPFPAQPPQHPYHPGTRAEEDRPANREGARHHPFSGQPPRSAHDRADRDEKERDRAKVTRPHSELQKSAGSKRPSPRSAAGSSTSENARIAPLEDEALNGD